MTPAKQTSQNVLVKAQQLLILHDLGPGWGPLCWVPLSSLIQLHVLGQRSSPRGDRSPGDTGNVWRHWWVLFAFSGEKTGKLQNLLWHTGQPHDKELSGTQCQKW